MLDNLSPLLTLGIIAMVLLGLALLYVFGRVLWLELFMGGPGPEDPDKKG